ncbi:MAG: PAS domain S-box protein [Candidatus Aminicenantes bacterium]|nr:PAS domain S-box protein [Candidatus Aminicenantes bacterium]
MATHQNTYESLKKENQELKRQLNTLLNFLESATDGIIFVQDGLIKYVNESAAKLVGHSPEELIGTSFERFIHPDDLKKVMETYEKRLKGENIPSRYELRIKGKEGKISYVEVNADIVNYQGKPVTISILRDITEKKKLMDEVNEKMLLLDTVFNNAPEALAILNTDRKVIRVNKKFSELFGYSQEDLKKLQAKIVPEHLLEESNMILEKVRSGQVVRIETTRINKSGEPVEVKIIASPIKKNNKVIGIYLVWADLSKLKKTEKSLKKSEERYKSIFEGSRDAIFIADENARFVEVNQAACELTGYSREELLNMRIPDLHGEADLHAYKKYFHQIMKGESILSEAKILRKDGTKVNTEFSNKRIFIDGIPYMHTVARDVSEWKKDKEKIKASLKEKEIMLHEIHHRVKNNMQIIISLMRIQGRKAKHKETRNYLQTLQDRVHSMSLIHDHFYQEREFDKINIVSYIKRLIDHLFFVYNTKQNQIKINLDLEKIYLDLNKAVPFGMLINEIISNVLKHAFPRRKKGEITLRLYRDDNRKIRLLVNDNGVGIPEEVDVENPSTIGLQLIKDLTQQLGGEIQIKSNGGTKIKVIFPEKNEVKGPEIRTR